MAVSCKSALTGRHFTEFLRIIVVSPYPLADIADIFKIGFFTFFHRRTGVYPYHIAVVMGTDIKGLAKIIGAG